MSLKRERGDEEYENEHEKAAKKRKVVHESLEDSDVNTIELASELDFGLYNHMSKHNDKWFSSEDLVPIAKSLDTVDMGEEIGHTDNLDIRVKTRIKAFLNKLQIQGFVLRESRSFEGKRCFFYKHCENDFELESHAAEDKDDDSFVPDEDSDGDEEMKDDVIKKEEGAKKKKKKKKKKKVKKVKEKEDKKKKKKKKKSTASKRKRRKSTNDEDEHDDDDDDYVEVGQQQQLHLQPQFQWNTNNNNNNSVFFQYSGDDLDDLLRTSIPGERDKAEFLTSFLLLSLDLLHRLKTESRYIEIANREINMKNVLFNIAEEEEEISSPSSNNFGKHQNQQVQQVPPPPLPSNVNIIQRKDDYDDDEEEEEEEEMNDEKKKKKKKKKKKTERSRKTSVSSLRNRRRGKEVQKKAQTVVPPQPVVIRKNTTTSMSSIQQQRQQKGIIIPPPPSLPLMMIEQTSASSSSATTTSTKFVIKNLSIDLSHSAQRKDTHNSGVFYSQILAKYGKMVFLPFSGGKEVLDYILVLSFQSPFPFDTIRNHIKQHAINHSLK